MKIGISLNQKGLNEIIPDKFEDAKGVMIIDADTLAIFDFREDIVAALVEWDCEAILCGEMYDAELFEAIADAFVTRYYAAGMTAKQATAEMNNNTLPIIPDYVGGPGCGDTPNAENDVCLGHCGEDEEESSACDGNCASCASACKNN